MTFSPKHPVSKIINVLNQKLTPKTDVTFNILHDLVDNTTYLPWVICDRFYQFFKQPRCFFWIARGILPDGYLKLDDKNHWYGIDRNFDSHKYGYFAQPIISKTFFVYKNIRCCISGNNITKFRFQYTEDEILKHTQIKVSSYGKCLELGIDFIDKLN